MKIAVSHPKLHIEGSLTEQETKFLEILEEDKEGIETLKYFREKHGIPKDGFNLDKKPNYYEDVDSKLVLGVSRYWEHLKLKYHLPDYWASTATNLFLFDIATPPDKTNKPPLEIRETESQLTIVVREALSKREFDKAIRKQNIGELLFKLPKTPAIGIEKLGFRKKLLKMKRSGKNSIDIAIKAEEETGNTKWVAEMVDSYNKRFEECIDNLQSKQWKKFLSSSK